MANVGFLRGKVENLPALAEAGKLYFTIDESIYLGLEDGSFHRYGDFIEVANKAALPEGGAHVKALYYCTDENVLAKWDGTQWVQINLDTNTTYEISAGATAGSVKLVGKNKAGEQVSSVEVQIVDVDALNTAIAAADAKGAQGIADAATAQAKGEEALAAAEAAQADVDALELKVGTVPEGSADVIAYIDKKTEGIATDTALAELQGKVTAAEGEIDALQEQVGEGTVDSQIDAKIDALKLAETYEPIGKGAEEAGKVQDNLDAYIESNDAAVAAAQKAADDEAARAKEAEAANKALAEAAQAAADAKVVSVTAGDASVTVAGTSTAPTVAVKVSADADNAISLEDDGLKVVIPAAAEYSVVKDENSGDYAAVYHLTKDGVNVGAAINIPKDLMVKSGSVVGENIVLVLNDEANTEIVIPASSLIEYVTSGSQTGDMVVVTVSDDHKVTATITDGTIGLAKLTTEVQTAIGKAHSHENADVLAGINADKVAAWDAAQANAEAKAAELDAALKEELEGSIADVDAKFADYSTTTEMNAAIKVETDRAVAKEEELAGDIAEVDGKFANYSTTEQMNAAIKVVDDKFANYTTTTDMNSAIATAKGEAIAEADAKDATNLQAAKDYADGLADNYDAAGSADTAETNAKTYAEGLLAWGEF